MFVEGQHFLHIRKNSRVLVITYAPIEVPLGRFPQFKSLEPLDVDRLMINPGANKFYQDCLDEVGDLVSDAVRNYETVIHYGFSAGAFAALKFGAADPKTTAIFALSPHLILKRPFTRCAQFVTEFSDNEDDWNVIPAINASECMHVYLIYPCCDLFDGIQVSDSFAITNPIINQLYYTLPHELYGVNEPYSIVKNFLDFGEHKILSAEHLASLDSQNDSITSHRIFSELMSGGNDFTGITLTGRITSKCGILPYMQARALHQQNLHNEALIKYSEAVMIMRENRCHLGELYFCMANNYLDLEIDELAFGAYRESMLRDSRHVDLHRVFVREAARRGRFEEIRFVMNRYAAALGRTPCLDAMDAELQPYLASAIDDVTAAPVETPPARPHTIADRNAIEPASMMSGAFRRLKRRFLRA